MEDQNIDFQAIIEWWLCQDGNCPTPTRRHRQQHRLRRRDVKPVAITEFISDAQHISDAKLYGYVPNNEPNAIADAYSFAHAYLHTSHTTH
jgi:hypothetical protein